MKKGGRISIGFGLMMDYIGQKYSVGCSQTNIIFYIIQKFDKTGYWHAMIGKTSAIYFQKDVSCQNPGDNAMNS